MRCDPFIARQLEGLRDLGLDEQALKREEVLLRAALAQSALFAAVFAKIIPP